MSSPALNHLYTAQNRGLSAFTSNPFSPYANNYIESQKGLAGYSAWISAGAYGALEGARRAQVALSSAFGSACEMIGSTLLGKQITAIFDYVFPTNVVNGQRHFIFIPKSIEKKLGDYLFYPLSTLGMQDSFEIMPSRTSTIAEKVEDTFQRLLQGNEKLLHPDEYATKFDYRIRTISSSQINAFAAPGGGMVVFSQIVKEIDSSIMNRSITETSVSFADGSRATVDLSSVKTEDVLAALIGHEMTHAASRHSMVALVGKMARSLLMTIGKFAIMSQIKLGDKSYQELISIPKDRRTIEQSRQLEQKETSFNTIYNVLSWLEDKICALANLFHSRKNEYEADITGAYMAKQAGFNPLGALYLQEVLGSKDNVIHKHFEFLFTHPYAENRKRALLAAIHSFDEVNTAAAIKEKNISQMAFNYDATYLSPALSISQNILRA